MDYILKKVNLTIPIEKDGVLFNSIDIPTPRGKDLRLLPRSVDNCNIEEFYPILSSLLQVKEDVIDQMAANDIIDIVETVSDFFQKTTLSNQ